MTVGSENGKNEKCLLALTILVYIFYLILYLFLFIFNVFLKDAKYVEKDNNVTESSVEGKKHITHVETRSNNRVFNFLQINVKGANSLFGYSDRFKEPTGFKPKKSAQTLLICKEKTSELK